MVKPHFSFSRMLEYIYLSHTSYSVVAPEEDRFIASMQRRNDKSDEYLSDRPTWQVVSCVIIVAVVLDKRWRWRNVAGLHRGHAGSSAHR